VSINDRTAIASVPDIIRLGRSLGSDERVDGWFRPSECAGHKFPKEIRVRTTDSPLKTSDTEEKMTGADAANSRSEWCDSTLQGAKDCAMNEPSTGRLLCAA
jgi:hypothetical protein